MKICLFGARMDLASGHSRPAFELGHELTKRGHAVSILSTQISPARQAKHEGLLALQPHLSELPVERPFDTVNGMLANRSHVRRYARDRLQHFDLLHAFSLNAFGVLAELAQSLPAAILTVNTKFRARPGDLLTSNLPSLWNLSTPRFLFSLLSPGRLFRRFFGHCERILTWTEFMRSEVLRFGVPSRKVSRVRLGLDLSRFHLDQSRPREGGPVYLHFGLVSSLRGSLDLLEAFKSVRADLPGAKLVIADRGAHMPADERRQAREIAAVMATVEEDNLGESISIRGFEADTSELINAADAVVLPFRSPMGYSQPPLTLLEAMAHGAPVVSTRVGSIEEVVADGKTGRLVMPGRPEELAEAMLEVAEEKGVEMGRAAAAHVRAQHSWDTGVEAVLGLYESVLPRQNP